jgi:peptidoglycan/LPS O-acetylase OafA/YrhL
MRNYWKSLDGLRALAVGIVMLAHAGSPFPRSGGVGVDIFFVLSGFLITGILSTEFQRYGSISRKNFYLRRLLRLTPALLASILLFAVLTWISNNFVRLDVIAITLTYTSNYARALFDYDLQSLAHCWSLAIEEQYYLLWPFVVVVVERNIRTILSKFLALLSLSLLLALYRAAMVGTFDATRINFALDTHMDGLVMGSALAYFAAFLATLKDSVALDRFLQLLSKLVVPASICGLLVIMHFITWGNPWMARLGYTLVAGGSCVIVLDLVASPFSLIRSFLENPFFTYFGKISYGLYLYHFPVYHFIEYELSDFSQIYVKAVMVTATIGIASLSYHLIERPILRFKEHYGHRLRSCPASAKPEPDASSLAPPDHG